jgi:hypothetical protein
LDCYTQQLIGIVDSHEPARHTDLQTISLPKIPDTSHLTRSSRKTIEVLSVGTSAWRKGWDRAQSMSAMTQAAFAIMKGQSIPQDPIYGVDYRWDPATRQLSMPAGKAFDDLEIAPISVPKL